MHVIFITLVHVSFCALTALCFFFLQLLWRPLRALRVLGYESLIYAPGFAYKHRPD